MWSGFLIDYYKIRHSILQLRRVNIKIIAENLIQFDKNFGETKEEIIKELAKILDAEGRLKNHDQFLEAVYAREELSTTGVGYQVAIPHGVTDAVDIPSVVFARLENEVDWNSLDDQPVKLVFLIASPKNSDENYHLKVLASLSRRLLDEEFIGNLLRSTDKSFIIESLKV